MPEIKTTAADEATKPKDADKTKPKEEKKEGITHYLVTLRHSLPIICVTPLH